MIFQLILRSEFFVQYFISKHIKYLHFHVLITFKCFIVTFYSGWSNEDADNQPPMNQQQQTSQQQPVQNENRFVANNSTRGNNRPKGHRGGRGGAPNNWNPHPQSGPPQQPPQQQPPPQQMVRFN